MNPTYSKRIMKILALLVSMFVAVTVTSPAYAARVPGDETSSVVDSTGPVTAASDEPELEVPVFTGDLRPAQWYLDAVGANGAHRAGFKGAGVIVAVVADGVDDLHPDLQGQVLPGYDATTRRPIALGTSHDFGDAGSNGTFQAALIAGDNDAKGLTGIAPDAKILPIVVENDLSLSDSVVADGILWAVERGATVITLALGISEGLTEAASTATCAAISTARAAGVLTFVPSQNDEVRVATQFKPATCADAVVVTAVAEDLTNPEKVAVTGVPSISAPGFSLLSAMQGEDWMPYTVARSTNWAAATAAGVAALIRSARPVLDADSVVAALRASATDIGAPGIDPTYGAGVVEAEVFVLDGPTKQLQDRLATAVQSSVPVIVGASRDGVGNTAISWEPPFGAKVLGYDVTTYRYTSTGWTSSTAAVGGLNVRTVVPFDLHTASYVTVTARTETGNRVSSPVNDSDYDPAEPLHERDDEDAAITAATSKWTTDGIEVDAVVNDTTRPWDVVVIDLSTGEIVKKLRVASATTRATVRLSLTHALRTKSLLVGAGIGRNGVDTWLLPYYGMDISVVPAGKTGAGVSGTTTCRDDRQIVCGTRKVAEGVVLKVLDAKSRKVLATARVRSDGSFTTFWKHPSKSYDIVVEAPNGETSARYGGSFWYR